MKADVTDKQNELVEVVNSIIDDYAQPYLARLLPPVKLLINSFDGRTGTAMLNGNRVQIESKIALTPGQRGIGVPLTPYLYYVVGAI